MAFPVLAQNVLEVRIYAQLNNQVSVNRVRYYCNSHNGTGGTDVQAAASFDASFSDLWKDAMTNSANYLGVAVQLLLPTRREPVVNKDNAGGGTRGTKPLPPQIAGLISLRTAIASKNQRGRMFLPFADEDDNEGLGRPTAAYLAALADIINGILVVRTFGAGGNTSVIQSTIVHTDGTLGARLTGGFARIGWSQQRRRSYLRHGDVLPI